MQYQAISNEGWGSMHGCVAGATKVRERCARLLTDLRAIFDKVEMQESVGLDFKEPSDASGDVGEILAYLESPIGRGRLRLEWGYGADGLVGMIHVEKKTLTPDDKNVWLPVWGLIVPQYGNPYVGSGDRRFQVNYDRMLGDALPRSLFECGMSMLYAISVKPV